MSKSKQRLGRWGEKLAEDYLLKHGYEVVDRNVRTPHGEIDLIARKIKESSGRDNPITVFVEVKTRSNRTYGYPEESVTPQKQAHLISSVQAYIQEQPDPQGEWQIDVIAIEVDGKTGKPSFTHFQNAVS